VTEVRAQSNYLWYGKKVANVTMDNPQLSLSEKRGKFND
jgi:hypothetical protein